MADQFGFDIHDSQVNPILKPFQRDCVRWAVRMGRAALFEAFGLGKSIQQMEVVRLTLAKVHETDPDALGLIVIPLGVRQEFFHDAAMLGTRVKFIRRIEEVEGPEVIYLTNYETVRDGKLDPRRFTVASLDEASVLRGFGGTKTFREFMATFAGDRKTMNDRIIGASVPYRFVATATPSPNEYIELLAYAAFLGVMDVGQSKTRFFKRDSTKADVLTLHPHKEKEFWLWVASWALFVQKPSDLGYSDEGYELPELDIHWHEIPDDHQDAGFDFRGQGMLIKQQAIGVVESAREKRDSLPKRIAKMMEIVDGCRVKESLLESVLRAEQGEATGTTESARESELSRQSREIQGPIQAMEGGEPRTDARIAAGPSGKESGQNQCSEQGVVCGEQATRPASNTGTEDQSLWNNPGTVSIDAGESAGEMCDLRNGESDQESGGKLQDRSLPQDGCGSRAALHEMQFGTGDVFRQYRNAPKSDGLSDQIVIWCDLNDEQKSIEKALRDAAISYSSLIGSQGLEERDELIAQWRRKETTAFVSKPVMYGAGVNLQQCHTMIFAGIGFKAQDLLQAIHRIHRFLQTHRCSVHLIFTEAEREVRRVLEQKWERHNDMVRKMKEIIKEYGLSSAAMAETLQRAIGVERIEVTGKDFRIINNDCVKESAAMAENSLDLILTSVPFSTQYEYSPNYADFGHTDNNAHFFQQMDFLTPNLLRALKPGRVAAIHVKDRIVPGGMTGLGYQTVYPFHARCIEHYMQHGFGYMGMITIVTDVVRENNQTYRLGWSEVCKDSSKISAGLPEYLLLFRKTPTDTSNAYADDPVVKTKADYSRSRWQTDAHGFWRSGGNRLMTPDELETLDHDVLFRWFRDYHLANIYDYEHHVKIGETTDAYGRLPVTFMLYQPPSWMDDVWTDVARMRTLNMLQSAKGKEQHLCLARGSLVLTRERGWVPIQEVGVGESVLTHQGRWRPVRIVRMTGVQPVIRLRAQGVPGLTLTPDHKLWTRKSDWVRERDGAERATPGWLRADETVSGGYVNLKLPPVEDCGLSDQELWLLGRWLADGHIGTRGDFFVSIGPEKLAEFEHMAGDFSGSRHEHTAVQIRFKGLGAELIRLLRKCGRGADGKQVPTELLAMPQNQARSLLDGYLSGDGHFLPERGRWMATSVSRPLLLGIAMLAQRVHGSIASLHEGRPAGSTVIDGREVQTRQEWVLSFDVGFNRRKSQFLLEDGAWKKVRGAEPVGEVETWCLRVDEDESFTAEGCIVKNCPLQFDICDRVIERFTNPGDTVFDPFGGIMSVPYRSILKGRKAIATELSTRYFMDGAHYLQAAEREMSMPDLFSSLEEEKKAA
ncbi:MAG: hypothetical protein EG825_00325 [Rhodocyclaceae bacterium]|nr:hypothetical protein [Rhodocyclaceae bacterium]